MQGCNNALCYFRPFRASSRKRIQCSHFLGINDRVVACFSSQRIGNAEEQDIVKSKKTRRFSWYIVVMMRLEKNS